MKSNLEIYTSCRNTSELHRAELIGFACLLIFLSKRYSLFQIITIRIWLIPAIDHKQILFLFNKIGVPLGYLTWAHLAPDSEQRLLEDSNYLLHTSEWNEGGRTWIIDCCFPSGDLPKAIKHIKKHLRKINIHKVFWARQNNKNSITKIKSYSLSKVEE